MEITLTSAIQICRTLEAVLAPSGFHVALGGSCLIEGKSSKDVDVIVYPHKSGDTRKDEEIIAILEKIGMTYISDRGYAHADDNKAVHQFEFLGYRVDIFILQ